MSKNLSSFLRRSYLMVGLFGWPKEKNALIDNPLEKATTPDDIIEAACINSIARDFDDWSKKRIKDGMDDFRKTKCPDPMMMAHIDGRYVYSTYSLSNGTKKIVVTWEMNYDDRKKNFTVNGIEFNDEKGKRIIKAFDDLATQRRVAKAKADAALAEMKRLESAWDLAENLLGMKRNEFGALVPKETVDAR